jgi:transmembrane sensor
MKYEDERPLADDMTPRVDEARLARQWSAISAGVAARPARRFFFAALVPAAVVALAVIVVLLARPWRDAAPPSVTVAHAPDALLLPDGSRVTLSNGAELTVEAATRERVHLALGAGVVDLDVTHVDGRTFVVTAAGHDVTVLGTAFSVKLVPVDGRRTLLVGVSRGRVRVSGPTGEHLLDAGQSWSSRVDGPPAPHPGAAPSATSALAPAVETSATAGNDPLEPSPPPAEPSANANPNAVANANANANASAKPIAPSPPVDGPRELLARATEARSAGRPRDAAIALDALRKHHRSDARAGLAAFELGRVRMDALNDPAGAAEAFADAIALAPSAPFREDAEARRIEALDAMPDRARCERARDAYLARFPSGLHARQVAQRCKRP